MATSIQDAQGAKSVEVIVLHRLEVRIHYEKLLILTTQLKHLQRILQESKEEELQFS